MFIGHQAIGFASKRAAPRVSLGWLMAAPMLLDLLWPVFLLLGIEHVRIAAKPSTPFLNFEFTDYPWSHSLLMACVWGVIYGGVYFWRSHDAAAGLTLAAGVVSHWVCDWIVHVPDLPLFPGGPKVGLGLWRSTAATIVVESLLFAAGILIYARMTRPRDRTGSATLWTLVILLYAIYLASTQGKPPADPTPVAIVTLSMILFPLWAAWIDRHREVRP